MFSTAADLQAFYQMSLNGGTYNGRRLLSRQTVDLMTAVHTGDLPAGHSPGMGYGLAWAVVREPLGALELLSVGTYGHGGAFGTEGWVDPKLDLIRILMIGRSAGGSSDERNALFNMAGAAITE
jgi:CubicO group peptidase (beta-lactamase class C family)